MHYAVTSVVLNVRLIYFEELVLAEQVAVLPVVPSEAVMLDCKQVVVEPSVVVAEEHLHRGRLER